MGNQTAREILQTRLTAQLDTDASAWLSEATAAVRTDAGAVAARFAEAARRVGRGVLSASPADAPDLPAGRFPMPTAAWRRADAARALLLLAAADSLGDAVMATAAGVYRAGDTDARIAVLRALALLPGGLPDSPLPAPPVAPGAEAGDTPAQAALRAMGDALRTNVVPLFDAATAGNAYFAAAVPELEYNKAVLKRVFMRMPISPVLGLAERANAELSRMLLNLIEECEVSWRAYPQEIWPVVAGYPLPGVLPKLIGLLEHPDDVLREAAATALARIGDPRGKQFAAERLERETRPPVRAALERAIR
jgi:hypothetical protein